MGMGLRALLLEGDAVVESLRAIAALLYPFKEREP